MNHSIVKRAAVLIVAMVALSSVAIFADANPGAINNAIDEKAPIIAPGPDPDMTMDQALQFAAGQEQEEAIQSGSLQSAAESALDKSQYAQAVADARQSIAISYGSGRAQEILAAALYGQGKMQDALQEYSNLATTGVYTYPYALLLLQSGTWAKAVDAYNKAIVNNGDVKLLRADTQFSPLVPQSDDLKAAILIGWAVSPNGGTFHGPYDQRIQQAQSMFEKAAKLVPDSAVAQYYVGYGLQRMGKRADAKAAYQKAADMGNSDVKVFADAGLTLVR